MTSRPPAQAPELLRITDACAVGPAIRARRRAQALRIGDAASLSGVSVDLLSRLENGKGSVRVDKLLAVLDNRGLALLLGPKYPYDAVRFACRRRPSGAAAKMLARHSSRGDDGTRRLKACRGINFGHAQVDVQQRLHGAIPLLPGANG